MIIVGAGPAGLSAAIYTARAGCKVLVMEKAVVGGQINITEEVINYPGIFRTDGKSLTSGMREQAEAFGAEFINCEVLSMELEGHIKRLHTTAGIFETIGVILATGANPRKIGFKGEKEFQGRGVAYCATCDGEFFTGMDIFVIGGGFAAVEEGIFLTRYGKTVNIIVRGEDFTCPKPVSDEIKKYGNINVSYNTELIEVGGKNTLEYAVFADRKTGDTRVYRPREGESFGVFVFAGYVPNTAWMGDEPLRNDQGYIITDSTGKTDKEGVYAAGDVCVKELRQVVTAVSDGATAATALEKYVALVHDKYSIPELKDKKTRARGYGDPAEKASESSAKSTEEKTFISSEIKAQLIPVFEKFEDRVIVRACLDESPLAMEMKGFMEELKDLSPKLICEIRENEMKEDMELPVIKLLREDGEDPGIAFHGIPGGHEFNSFIVALYNLSTGVKDPGKETEDIIKNISAPLSMKIFVSLSCTMCPETVMSAQKLAALSPKVRAEMFDLGHWPEYRKKYNIMSVPCTVINDSRVVFGKKSLPELADIIKEEQKA